MRLAALAAVLALAASVAACGGDEGANTQSGTSVTIVASVYPLAWLGEQIGPDARVVSLVSGSLEAHDVELTPQQRGTLESADVVLYLGDIGYQPQVEEAIESAGGQVVAADEVAGAASLREAVEDDHAHAGEEHKDEAEPSESGKAEKAIDAHLWFDPKILAKLATATGEAFAKADPADADGYRSRAAEVVADVEAVGKDIAATLGGTCRFDEAIVSHAAYGYLLAPYRLEQHAVSGIDAEEDASAGELAEIVAEIRDAGFTHVLTEPIEGRDGAETVAREAGVPLLEISPLDAVSAEQAARGLPALLREQAKAFGTALGCT